MTRWELKRRSFLRALGVGAGMLPVLAETRHASAASGLGRLITVVKGNGTRAETFWPTGAGADGSLNGAVFPHVVAPLKDLREKLLFLDGITLRNWLKSEGNTTGDNGDAHHNWGNLLTGTLPGPATSSDGGCRLNAGGCHMGAGSASLDCFVGQALRKKDPSLAFDSLHLSLNADDLSTARRGSGMSCPSWFDKDVPNPPEPDVKTVFTKIFGGRQLSTGGVANEGLWRKRVRLLDFVGKDLERFAKNLGRDDRQAAEAHLTSVHRRQDELNRLLSSPPAMCKTPAAPTLDYLVKNEANVPGRSKLMMDMHR
ncbi:MAG: DUF1552 domain-containing protein [Deltaproteobacteria bacterium]|nr:DUF1552 domain-containing protein [Deltaproteobacteria bacterium]